ncbi:MlaA family lipoprotein [Gymnodinialimonas sp.]
MTFSKLPGRLCAVALALLVTACGPATLPPGDQIADADEARNRAAHATNIALDRAVLDPVATAYGTAVPEPVRVGVSNFASNLNQPGYVVNNILQLRLGDAAQNTLRFALNSTIGVGGLFDVATALGVPEEETDFGETLHLYGVGEGDYVVHPFLGPSTTRDTVGRVVDFAMNPLRHHIDAPESYYSTGASIGSALNSRYAFDDTIDSVLYESADSYLQMRSLYLQQRRFELGGTAATYEDPYANEDPAAAAEAVAADPYYDPYSDPYFDPYAQ